MRIQLPELRRCVRPTRRRGLPSLCCRRAPRSFCCRRAGAWCHDVISHLVAHLGHQHIFLAGFWFHIAFTPFPSPFLPCPSVTLPLSILPVWIRVLSPVLLSPLSFATRRLLFGLLPFLEPHAQAEGVTYTSFLDKLSTLPAQAVAVFGMIISFAIPSLPVCFSLR